MNCNFCQSEINQEDIIEKETWSGRTGGETTYLLKYNCPECIQPWLSGDCAAQLPIEDTFKGHPDRLMNVGKYIRGLCEKGSDNCLEKPLSIQDLIKLWHQYMRER